MSRVVFRVLSSGFYEEEILGILCKHLINRFLGAQCFYEFLDYPPGKYYDSSRKQFRADLVLRWFASHRSSSEEILVGLVNSDGYVPGLNFVFGLADPSERIATVYLRRLYTSSNHVDNIFVERLLKEATHEIGHVLGLEHCSNPRCVMSFSNSILDVDYKTNLFCKRCVEKLSKRGLVVNQRELI